MWKTSIGRKFWDPPSSWNSIHRWAKSVTFHNISIIFLKASGFDLTVTWCRSMKAFPSPLPLGSLFTLQSGKSFSPPPSSLICYGNSISFCLSLPQLLTIHRSISRPYTEFIIDKYIIENIIERRFFRRSDFFLHHHYYFRLTTII